MASQDLHNNVFAENGFNTQLINSDTTTNGEIIDTQNFESLEYFIQGGVVTNGTFTPELEHGDDAALADAAAVPSDFILGSLSDAVVDASDEVKRVGYVGHKRYVRLNLVSAGATADGTVGATAVLSHFRHNPTEDQA